MNEAHHKWCSCASAVSAQAPIFLDAYPEPRWQSWSCGICQAADVGNCLLFEGLWKALGSIFLMGSVSCCED